MPTAVSELYQNAPARATRAEIGQRTHRADRQRPVSERADPITAANPPAHGATALDGLGCPIQIIHFPDAFAVWLRNPMEADTLASLRRLCGGKLRIENRKSRFNPELIQRLVLRQPSREAIELLAARNDVHFNAGELAQDLIYRTISERDEAHRFHLAHSLRKDRRGQMMAICLGIDGQTTSYSGPREAKSRLVAYPCKSKMAKRHPALHIEERSSTSRALASHGIRSLRDLLNFDHLHFWRDRLHYYRFTDVEGLGRAHLNHFDRQENPTSPARRKAKLKRIGNHTVMNIDKRIGHLLIRILGSFGAEQITIGAKARKAGLHAADMPGYSDVYEAVTIQNLYDRLNHIIPLDRFLSRIAISANSEIATYMRGSETAARLTDAANAKIAARYAADKRRLERKFQPRRTAAK
jgi:hypothetical protein